MMNHARSLWKIPALHFKVRAIPAYFGAHAMLTGSVFAVLVWASLFALKAEDIPGARQVYYWDGFMSHVFGIKITSPRALRAASLVYLLLFLVNLIAELPSTQSVQTQRTAMLFNIVVEVWLCAEAFYFQSVSRVFVALVLLVLFLFALVTVERSDIKEAPPAATPPSPCPEPNDGELKQVDKDSHVEHVERAERAQQAQDAQHED